VNGHVFIGGINAYTSADSDFSKKDLGNVY